MSFREQELKEVFIAESLETYDSLNSLMVDLEKNPSDQMLIAEIFRLIHNIKANAKAIGLSHLAEIAHQLETAFGGVRSGDLIFTGEVANTLMEGVEAIGDIIRNIDNPDFQILNTELQSNLDAIIANLSGAQIELQSIRKYYNNQKISLSDLIHIKLSKLDDLLNLVGELILDKDRLLAISSRLDDEELTGVCDHLHRVTSSLQNNVMDARLVNVSSLFHKFPKVVRDVAMVEGKKADLIISGDNIKIDRNILQTITDSLLHLIRNAVSHGIESPDERISNGKPETGTVHVTANNEKETVIIRISDDGKGIDVDKIRSLLVKENVISSEKAKGMSNKEILPYVFMPGFSMSGKITEFAGRGVGLDVVRSAVDSVGGKVAIESEKGKNTVFTLSIPVSLAVRGSLLFESGGSPYAIPLINTQYVTNHPAENVHEAAGSMFININNELIPIINLKSLFASPLNNAAFGRKHELVNSFLSIIVVNYNNRSLGLIADKMLRQQDIVVKPLKKPIDKSKFFGGVTLLGKGETCLVLDVPFLTKFYFSKV
ncbi:chemotaxis protein CheW [Cytophagaceae bacterium ABcell3]|nr:chemotaxis protein CheW [Cytophagaceae bacterium ABcell3]